MIETERLILRGWREADVAPFAAMNADPEVMRHFPAPMTADESAAMIRVNQAHIDAEGFGLWAVERRADGAFLGFTGLRRVAPQNPMAPAVEIAWRLARHAWGEGYASEAARAALAFGFGKGQPEIVSFTATENERSQAVMRRIGMTREADRDFDHPAVPEGHRLRPHVVYAMRPSPPRGGEEPGS